MRRLIPLALLCASMYGQSYHWERVHRVKDCQYQGYDHGNLRIGGILHCKPDKYWSAWLLGAGLLPERFDSAKEARRYVENPVPLTATAAFPDHGLYIAHVRKETISAPAHKLGWSYTVARFGCVSHYFYRHAESFAAGEVRQCSLWDTSIAATGGLWQAAFNGPQTPKRFKTEQEAKRYVEKMLADVPWPTCSQPWPKPQPPNCPVPPR